MKYVLVVGLSFYLIIFPSVSRAEVRGRIFSVPISFSSNESVTAVDYIVDVKGGEVISFNCGSIEFTKLIQQENRCVSFNPHGSRSSTIGTVKVRSESDAAELVVNVTGMMSNAFGTEPTLRVFNGGRFPITDQEVTHRMGDLNGDSQITIHDFGIFAGYYAKRDIDNDSAVELQIADLDNNGIISIFDLGRLVELFRSR
ncbi:hypothetical protein HGA91_04670 [candidate division WWE3 bacterium]|nr:hypothetical protein [candidate division WWE3 bacterium]